MWLSPTPASAKTGSTYLARHINGPRPDGVAGRLGRTNEHHSLSYHTYILHSAAPCRNQPRAHFHAAHTFAFWGGCITHTDGRRGPEASTVPYRTYMEHIWEYGTR